MLVATLDKSALESVRTLERLRIVATGSNDVEALAPLLDDDLIYINSVGDVYNKSGYLDAIRTHRLTYGPDFDVRETACRVAEGFIIVVGIMLGHARLDGEQQVFHFRCLSVWRQKCSTWRLFAWQSSAIVSVPDWRVSSRLISG
jgi:hypothetical protein